MGIVWQNAYAIGTQHGLTEDDLLHLMGKHDNTLMMTQLYRLAVSPHVSPHTLLVPLDSATQQNSLASGT